MELLGLVEEVTMDGSLISRCSSPPDIGDPIFSRKERKIGTVKRIFGPVDDPYVSITVVDGTNPESIRGTELYYTRGQVNGKGKRRNRRD